VAATAARQAAAAADPQAAPASPPQGSPLTLRDLDAIGVERLHSVGRSQARRRGLAAHEIATLLDLLQHYPRRYVDRTRQAPIGDLEPGDEVTVLGEVQQVSTRRLRGRRTLTDVVIADSSGSLRLAFFNQPWLERQLREGMQVLAFGKFERFRGAAQMTAPLLDLVGDQTGRIMPVYPQTEKSGLTTRTIAGFVAEALRRCEQRGFADPLPDSLRRRLGLVGRDTAMRDIHMPGSSDDIAEARKRLVFDELLRVQLELVRRKRRTESSSIGFEHRTSGELVRRFAERLPFALTAAQRRAIAEIDEDLRRPRPMHRLLQGDVGSGKTLVAVHALLVAVQGGHQGALMVPTEVLAEQHHAAVIELLDGLEVPEPDSLLGMRQLRVALLVGKLGAARRRAVLAELAAGSIDILIGTHALISENVDYASLGVVVIDEQHRFGVEQRAALRDKGGGTATPDVLVMTATPIPRTAAMTVYGDLDESVIDEMPPGRTPIVTHSVGRTLGEESVAWDAVTAAAAEGRQAYVVCPLIGESEALDVSAAVDTYTDLKAQELSGLRVGLLHGRMSGEDKEAVMARFRCGALDVLVSTTVIEVGVDVANATVMVILDADRFGIAQLHQLRGRVGRGDHPGSCYLVSELPTSDSKLRIAALVDSTDGFKLAEKDLEMRGEGTIMGERQRGRNDLRLASLRLDREWVVKAREAAIEIVDSDPELEGHSGLADELEAVLGADDAEFLLKN